MQQEDNANRMGLTAAELSSLAEQTQRLALRIPGTAAPTEMRTDAVESAALDLPGVGRHRASPQAAPRSTAI